MRVFYIHADNKGDHNSMVWRCEKPSYALRLAGHKTEIRHWQEYSFQEVLDFEPDIVFYQRYCWRGYAYDGTINDAIDEVKKLKEIGVTTVYDFDDDYTEITENNLGYEFWVNGRGPDGKGGMTQYLPPKPIKSFNWMLNTVDVVTTPSSHLALKFNARLLENMPMRKWWGKLRKRNSKTKVVGWGGGSSHYESWRDSEIIAGLVQASIDNKWNIRIQGAVNVMNAILNVMQASKRKPMTQFKKFSPPEHWARDLMASYDLYVIPLANEYDKARSPIKVLECGLAGVPWIATSNGVYDDFRQFGTLVQNSKDEWYEAISHAMKNNEAQKQAALSARNYILDHYMVEDNVDHILEVYTP